MSTRGSMEGVSAMRVAFRAGSRSVPRHSRIHVARPGLESTAQVLELAKARAMQHLEGAHAALPDMALEHDLAARIQLAHALGQRVERDQDRARDARDLVLLGLAHVDQHEVFAPL